MIVLDENIFASQRAALLARRMRPRQIGCDVGRKGMQDDEIIALLRQLRRPTLCSRDRDFFKKSLCSEKYCLVQLVVKPLDVAEYVGRLLRHPDFKTWSQRRGCVLRVSTSGISVWRIGASRTARHHWSNKR